MSKFLSKVILFIAYCPLQIEKMNALNLDAIIFSANAKIKKTTQFTPLFLLFFYDSSGETSRRFREDNPYRGACIFRWS